MILRPCTLFVRAVIVAVACVWLLCSTLGCKSQQKHDTHATPVLGSKQLTLPALRSEVMSAADNYVIILTQSLDELRADTQSTEVANWALRTKIATAIAAYTNATGPNGAVALIDMMILARLKRIALEEHWIPTLLGPIEGPPVFEGFKRGEASVWHLGATALTAKQLQELSDLIESWRNAHPEQYYVSHIRFDEFASYRQISPDSKTGKMPGNIFGYLYMDPLSGLDPVARELHNYRELTERMLYLFSRMPAIFSWELELAVSQTATAPETERAMASVESFSNATTRFADAAVKYPDDLSKMFRETVTQLSTATATERKAAIDQLATATSAERKATVDQLAAVTATERAAAIDQLATATDKATTQAVTHAASSSQALIDYAFTRLMILIVVILVGLPVMMLIYKLLSRRISGPKSGEDANWGARIRS
jgi:hypothetical protein